MLFIVDNQKDFLTDAYVHGLDTRNKNHLYLPVVSLSCVHFTLGSKCLIAIQAIYRVMEMTGKHSKASYTDALLFIPFIQVLNF